MSNRRFAAAAFLVMHHLTRPYSGARIEVSYFTSGRARPLTVRRHVATCDRFLNLCQYREEHRLPSNSSSEITLRVLRTKWTKKGEFGTSIERTHGA